MTDTYDFSDVSDPFSDVQDPFANVVDPFSGVVDPFTNNAPSSTGGLSDIKGFNQLDDDPVKPPTVGDLLKAGAKDLLTAKSNERSLELAERIAKPGTINTSDSGTLGFSPRSMQEQVQGYTDTGRAELRDKLEGQIDNTQKLQAEANEVPYSPSTQQFLNDNSENSAWSDFWADPVTIVKEVGIRSAPASVLSLAGGVAGAVATGGNPLAFAGGAGVVSARLEYGNSIMDALRNEGVDITSADDLIAAQKDPSLMKRVKKFATERAEVIGAMDAIAGGVASKNLGAFVAPGLKREMANLGLQSVTQMGLGAAGEAGAQYRTEGEISSPRGVAAEAVGELVTAPIDVAGATLSQAKDVSSNRHAKRDAAELDELNAQAEKWNADFANANDPFLLTGTIAPEPEFVRPDEPVFNVDGEGNVDTSGAVAAQAKEAAKQAEADKIAAAAERAKDLKSKTKFEWVQVTNNVGEEQTVLLDRSTGEYHGDTSRLNVDDEQHRNEYEAKIQQMITQRSEEADLSRQNATAEYDPNKVFAPPSPKQKPTEESKDETEAKEQATFDYLSSKTHFTPEQTSALYDYNEAEGKSAFEMDDKQAKTLIEAAKNNVTDKEVVLYRSDPLSEGLKARHEFESRSLIPTTASKQWAVDWSGHYGEAEISEITVMPGVPLVTVNQGNTGEKEVLLYGPDIILEKVSERKIPEYTEGSEYNLVSSQYIARPKTAAEKSAGAKAINPDVDVKALAEQIDLAVQDTNTEPTPAQAEANNYKKGRFDLNGLKVAIENPKGSVRKGVDPDGKAWENQIKHHYGDISGVKGADGDNMDVFVGDNPTSSRVFVIDQVDPKTGKFDEHKVMTGFDSLEEAKAGYLANYDKNWKGLGEISEVDFDGFKTWTKEGDTQKPFAPQAKPPVDVASTKPAITIEPLSEKAVLIKGVPKEMRAIMNDAGNVKAIWRRKEQAWMLPKKRLEKLMGELEQHFTMPGTEPVVAEDLPKREENLPIKENTLPKGEEVKAVVNTPSLDNVDSITDNRKLKTAIAAEQGVKASEVSDQMLKEGQEKLELALVGKARAVIESDVDNDTGTTYKKLVDLYQAQPNLNVRSSTSMENQAYSTPAPLSYLASKLAGITKDSTVYEPTAGNGMLLIGAAHKHVTANELNDLRAEQLRAQGFTVTQNDATTFVPDAKVDAVIMNPPFGKLRDDDGRIAPVKVDGYTIKSIDHLIAAKALESMKDDGRATIIIGASKKEGDIGPSDRTFFNWLYSHYNVTDHFEVDGDLYKRQGAGWPVRVITINGRVDSKNISPVTGSIERVRSWDEVYDRYTESVDSRKTGSDQSGTESVDGARQSDASHGQTSAEVEDGREAGSTNKAGSGTKSGRSRDTGSNAGSGVSSSSKRNTESASARDDRSREPKRADLQSELNPEEQSSTRREPDTNKSVTKRTDGGSAARNRKPSVKSSGFQSNYVTRSTGSNEAVLTPVNMSGATERALSALEADVGGIDDYVIDKLGYESLEDLHKSFMGLQVDTIAAGVYNIEKGKGIIIADQTGVGKGRQAAGIIRYALREGKIPVFISVKDNLFTDMYNDLKDIGTEDVRPFILNQDAVVKSDGESLFGNPTRKNHIGRMQDIISTGQLPDDANMLFLTYSQLNTDNRQRHLINAIKDRAVFVMDESHNAAGERVKITKKGKQSTTAGFIYQAIEDRPVVYLSATYAKRPDNMPIYYRTDLMDAVDTVDELVTAVAAGGAPLQTVMSGMLAENGQLFRRERSFGGIEVKTVIDVASTAKHTKFADAVTKGLRAITEADSTFHNVFVEQYAATIQLEGGDAFGAGNRAESGVDHTNFTSIVHNFISQLLLGLKAESAAKQAIALHKQGVKPVIALENTMGSFLRSYVEDNGAQVGDVIDADYRDVLTRALDRTRRISVKSANGDQKAIDIPLSKLDPYTRSMYKKAQAAIDQLQVGDLPISPIDYVRNELEKEGISVSEITGRDFRIDYSSGEPVLAKRDVKEVKDRRGTVDGFNDGSIDALVLNAAGSTGLSIHASEKFPDKKPRHMLVMQAMADINILMQMLGRINRTGQVTLPGYTMMGVNIPAEKRPLARTSNKMKSLNANTSANTDSDTSIDAPDIMNKYGDRVVNGYLRENPEIALAVNVTPAASDESAMPGLATQFTGRIALLPVKKQNEIYEDIETDYNDLIEYLDKTNQNDLVPTTIDLDARILESKVAYEGKSPDTLFGGHTILHKVNAKYQGKPPTPKDVEAALDKALKDKTPQEISDALFLGKSLDTVYEDGLKARVNKAELAAEKLVSSDDADKKGKADAAFESANKALNDYIGTRETMTRMSGIFMVGNHIRLNLGDEIVTGVVVGLRDAHKKGKGNPYALSKVRVSFMVNSGIRQIDLPFSRLGDPAIFVERLTNKGITGLEDVFSADLAGHERREVRYVATHNLIAGSAKLHGGRITTFTDNKGGTHQGILMPRSYGKDGQFEAVGSSQNFAMRDNAVLVKYLKANADSLESAGVASVTGSVRLQPDGRGDWKITIPKSNKDANAREVKFDDGLRKAMGTDFYGKGKDMTAVFPASKLAKVVPILNELALMYGLPSYRDAWVAAGGNKTATAVNSFSTEEVGPKEEKAALQEEKRKDPAEGISFSQSTNGKGTDKAFIKKLVDKQVLSWPSAPPVVVVQSVTELPGYIQEAIRVRNAVNVSGVRDQQSGNIYLVADNLQNGLKAKKVLAHEVVGHYAMEEMLGDEFTKVVDLVQRLKGRDKTIKQLAGQVKGEGNAYIESAEIIAKMAEDGIKHPALVKAYAALRNFLRRLGFAIEFSLADLKGMLVDAALWLRKPIKYSDKAADAGIYSQAAFSQDEGPESVINKKGSDMSKAARLERAEAMGFDTSKVWYHGTGASFSQFSKDQLGGFTGAQSAQQGFFFTDNYNLARQFATEASQSKISIPDIEKALSGLSKEDKTRLYDEARLGDTYGYLEYMDEAEAIEVLNDSMISFATDVVDDISQSYIDDRIGLDKIAAKYIGKEIFSGGEVKQVFLKKGKIKKHTFDSDVFEEGVVNNILTESKKQGFNAVEFENMYDSAVGSDKGETSIKSNVTVVFEPNQVRSIHADFNDDQSDSPNLLFSQDSPDGRFAQDVNQYGKEVTDSLVKVWKKNWTADLRPAWLALLTRRHLADIAGGVLPQIKQYTGIAQAMDTRRNELLTEGAKIADRWSAFNIKNRAQAQKLADLMHDSTLAGVDPSKPHVVIMTQEELDEIKRVNTLLIKDRSRDHAGGGKSGIRSPAQLREEIRQAEIKMGQEVNRKKARKEMVARWNELSPEAQGIYREVRDIYRDRQNKTMEALEARIGRTITDGKYAKALIDMLRSEFEEVAVQEPYFPLARFGDYWVFASLGDTDKSFQMFETTAEQEAYMQEMSDKGYKVRHGVKLENLKELDGVSSSFVANVEALIDEKLGKSPQADQIRDEIYQMYLKSLPDLSMRKHSLHRKKTKGFAKDALRAYAHNLFHGSYQLARLEYVDQLQAELKDMEEGLSADPDKLAEDLAVHKMAMGMEAMAEQSLRQMLGGLNSKINNDVDLSDMESRTRNAVKLALKHRDSPKALASANAKLLRIKSSVLQIGKDKVKAGHLYKEMLKRHEWAMNPKGSAWANMASSIGFTWYLGVSPAAAFVNLTQTPAVALPMMAARFGWSASSRALGRTSQEFMKGGFGIESQLKGDRLKAYEEAVTSGVIDKTLAHDLAAVSQEGATYNPVRNKVMGGVSFLFHNAERMNREVTYMAAYDLAREKGVRHDQAVQSAHDLTWDSHFDYSSGNKARVMQGDIPKVILMFRQFSLNMSYLLVRSAQQWASKDTDPKTRQVARDQLLGILGMHFAFAGAIGLPLFSVLAGVVNAVFDDEDEPYDFEVEMRNYLADTLPKPAADALSKGLFNAVLGVDVHSRTSLNDLWFRSSNRELEGRDAVAYWFEQLMGPMGGIALGTGTAYQQFQDGQGLRALESTVPKFAKDILKGYRYADEGVNTMRGDPLIENLPPALALVQAMGLSPAALNDQYDANSAVKGKERAILDRKQNLMNNFYLAYRAGDSAQQAEVIEKVQRFNRKNPRVRIKKADLIKSIRARKRASARSEHGVMVSKKLRHLREEGRFAE